MGIFSRMRDIINSNINAMLDAAENPEKLLKLMIQEMEDTLIEIKAQCAGTMAHSKSLERAVDEAKDKSDEWDRKAQMAMEKGRDDLAREALLERRHYQARADSLAAEKIECETLIDQYKSDITQLEAKMTSVREKQKMLVQRHLHAQARRRAEEHLRQADGVEVMSRFDVFERRIDHMEAEADLVNFGRRTELDKEFQALETDEQLDKEMEQLRTRMKSGSQDSPEGEQPTA